MFLPDEIINIILSYREVNPTAKLIRKSIEDYETLMNNNKIGFKFKSYYLSTLMGYKYMVDFKIWRKKNILFEPQSKIVMEKRRLVGIDGIVRFNDNDRKLYEEHCKNIEIHDILTSFISDIQHSITFTGMIHEEYFHRLYNSKKRGTYDKWCDNYKKWYNKYRNEIYNGNKVLEKRVDGDDENDDFFERERTDCRVIFGLLY
jgi:hypothetical protein